MPRVRRQRGGKGVRKSNALDRIQPVSLGAEPIRINIYGRSASGKTTVACTFPKPLLLIAAEKGIRSVHNLKGVDYLWLQGEEDMVQLLEYLPTNKHKYKTVVLDTITAMQDLVLRDLLGLDTVPLQKDWGMASRDQWGTCAVRVKELTNALIQLPIHSVILAQEREFNVDEGEGATLEPYVASAATPSVVKWLGPACDFVCQTFIRRKMKSKEVKIGKNRVTKHIPIPGKVEYCLRIGPHPVYASKFRRPLGDEELPQVIVNPTYEKLLSFM